MGSVCGAVWSGPLRVAEVYVYVALEHLDSLCELQFPRIHCTYELDRSTLKSLLPMSMRIS